MTEDADELTALLGESPPAGVLALPAQARAELAGLIASARRQQAADLAVAFEATLKHVPFPLRGLAKRMLLG